MNLDELVSQFSKVYRKNSGGEDLIVFFYKILRERDLCEDYIRHAEAGGDKELVEFFKEVQAQDRLRACRAEELLKRVIH